MSQSGRTRRVLFLLERGLTVAAAMMGGSMACSMSADGEVEEFVELRLMKFRTVGLNT